MTGLGLTSDLWDVAADVLGLRSAQPSAQHAPPVPMPAQPVLRYASGEEATADYRLIMRALYLEHQAFGLRQRPDQIARRVRERFGADLESEVVERRLDQLHQWTAVDREHDAGLASSAAEWRRNRYTYDVTRAGRLTESLLQQLDQLGTEHGSLDAARVRNVLDTLGRLTAELGSPDPDGRALRQLLETLLAEVTALHTGALSFLKELGALIHRTEQVDEAEFTRSKGGLVDHIQGFRRTRRAMAQEVRAGLDAVEALGVDRLTTLIGDAEDLVALPGGPSVAEQRAQRREELRDRWTGIRAWFGDDAADADAPWQTLDAQVVAAVQAVLSIAERLIERRSSRVDRARVHLRLAAIAAAAPPGDAPAVVRAALGLRSPRHLGVPETHPEQLAEPGRTSWRAAEPAPVIAHLRRPGQANPGRGRGAPVPDLSAARRAVAERRVAEREQLEAALARFATGGALRMSHLERVDARELSQLLAWIGRAYEGAPAPDGTRRAVSIDGRASIRLVPPTEPRPTVALLTPLGRLRLPDFALEVTRR